MADVKTEYNDPSKQSLTWVFLTLNTLKLMQEADVQGDVERYFTQYKWAWRYLMGYVEMEDRKKIEQDFIMLNESISKLERATEVNTATKTSVANKLKLSFVESHLHYIMMAMSKTGIYNISEEAKIPVGSLEFLELQEIIKAHTGVITSLERKVKENDRTTAGVTNSMPEPNSAATP